MITDFQKGEWWTAPAVGDNGGNVIVTGRKDIDKFRSNTRFNIRVEVSWRYSPDPSGMPQSEDAELMDKVNQALLQAFGKDPVAVMTGIFTGDGERTWVFYTLSTHIFGRKLNEALKPLPLLPLSVYCENDAEWAEYDEMSQLEIN